MSAPTTRTLGHDDWCTPGHIFDPLHDVFDFTGDASATDSTVAKCSRFISPEQDALCTTWDTIGPRVWLNPPYGRHISKWFERAEGQVSSGNVDLVAMLVYANTDTRYWHALVARSPWCHTVAFLSPRVRFERPGGERASGAPKGSALVLYRSHRRVGALSHLYLDTGKPGWAGGLG